VSNLRTFDSGGRARHKQVMATTPMEISRERERERGRSRGREGGRVEMAYPTEAAPNPSTRDPARGREGGRVEMAYPAETTAKTLARGIQLEGELGKP
jgi:hypothetical protein